MILLAVSVNRLCSLPFVPEYFYFDPFLFYDIVDKDGVNVGISLRSFIYMVTIHFAWILLWVREIRLKNSTSELFKCFLYIEALSLIDFFLIYEQSWFSIGLYNVEFTDFKIIMYAISIIKWNSTGNS